MEKEKLLKLICEQCRGGESCDRRSSCEPLATATSLMRRIAFFAVLDYYSAVSDVLLSLNQGGEAFEDFSAGYLTGIFNKPEHDV